MKATHNFKQHVKDILCEMAVDCTLPVDMTCLDIDTVFDKAMERYGRQYRLDKLAEFVSYENFGDLDNMLDILESPDLDGNDIAGWVEGITMLERFETSFTVKDLLEQISD